MSCKCWFKLKPTPFFGEALLKIFVSIYVTATLLLFHSVSIAETIYLSAAASMTDAIKEITRQYKEDHPEIKIQLNLAGSGSLAKQITQGAPADIYISANPKWMEYLVLQKMITPGTDLTLVHNALVFISDKSEQDLSISTISNLKRIAIGSPQNVPAGMYAQQAMENANIYKVLQRDNKLIHAKDVRQALLYADRGEVDGAFVYQTDAMIAKNVRPAFTVPQDLYQEISYPIALTLAGAKKAGAVDFYNFIRNLDTAKTFIKYGFEPTNR